MDTTTLPCPRRGGTALGGSQEDCGQARTAGRWGLPQAGCREALECEKLKACPRLHAHKWMFSLLLSETAPTARSLEGGGGQWGGREATVRAGPQPLAVRGCRPELGGGRGGPVRLHAHRMALPHPGGAGFSEQQHRGPAWCGPPSPHSHRDAARAWPGGRGHGLGSGRNPSSSSSWRAASR